MAKIPPDPEPDNSPEGYIRAQVARGAATRRQLERWQVQEIFRRLSRGGALSPKQHRRIVDILHRGREEAFCRAWLENLDREGLLDTCRNILGGLAEKEAIAATFGAWPPSPLGVPDSPSPAPLEISERERVRQSKPEATTGPPGKRKRPRWPAEARKPLNSSVGQTNLISARKNKPADFSAARPCALGARPTLAAEDLAELEFAQQISWLHALGPSALVKFLSLFGAERLLRTPLETALDRFLRGRPITPASQEKTGRHGSPTGCLPFHGGPSQPSAKRHLAQWGI